MEPVAGEEFTLDASPSSDEYGELVGYEWTVAGDRLTGQQVTVTVAEAGTIDVTLTVENDAGNTDTITETVAVGADDGTAPQDEDGTDETSDETDDADGGDGDDEGDTNGTGDDTEDQEGVDAEGPGFGVLVAILAVLAVAVVTRYRETNL